MGSMRYPWVLALGLTGCTNNTITIESDSESEAEPPATATDGTEPTPPATTLPPSTTGIPPSTSTLPPMTTVGSAVTGDDTWDDTAGVDCVPPCPDGQVCVAGVCFDDPDPETTGGCFTMDTWSGCLADDGNPMQALCTNPDAVCAVDNAGSPSFSLCVQPCQDICDCPAPPLTGTATVMCGDVLGTGDTWCHLNCQSGADCPDGMECFRGAMCIVPS